MQKIRIDGNTPTEIIGLDSKSLDNIDIVYLNYNQNIYILATKYIAILDIDTEQYDIYKITFPEDLDSYCDYKYVESIFYERYGDAQYTREELSSRWNQYMIAYTLSNLIDLIRSGDTSTSNIKMIMCAYNNSSFEVCIDARYDLVHNALLGKICFPETIEDADISVIKAYTDEDYENCVIINGHQ